MVPWRPADPEKEYQSNKRMPNVTHDSSWVALHCVCAREGDGKKGTRSGESEMATHVCERGANITMRWRTGSDVAALRIPPPSLSDLYQHQEVTSLQLRLIILDDG